MQRKAISFNGQKIFIGIDVHKDSWRVAIAPEVGIVKGHTQKEKLKGEVELDECFVGGKNKNKHWNKKVPKSKGRCHVDKVPVMGMLERGGRVSAS